MQNPTGRAASRSITSSLRESTPRIVRPVAAMNRLMPTSSRVVLPGCIQRAFRCFPRFRRVRDVYTLTMFFGGRPARQGVSPGPPVELSGAGPVGTHGDSLDRRALVPYGWSAGSDKSCTDLGDVRAHLRQGGARSRRRSECTYRPADRTCSTRSWRSAGGPRSPGLESVSAVHEHLDPVVEVSCGAACRSTCQPRAIRQPAHQPGTSPPMVSDL